MDGLEGVEADLVLVVGALREVFGFRRRRVLLPGGGDSAVSCGSRDIVEELRLVRRDACRGFSHHFFREERGGRAKKKRNVPEESRTSNTSSGMRSPPASSQFSELMDAMERDMARLAIERFLGRDCIDMAERSRVNPVSSACNIRVLAGGLAWLLDDCWAPR
mmetsp:Transcript_37980/g.121898  ORF Transcript_37980/g.121898 Transcript_37980/m.121898 type:complete len:163 (+) Transcript_37980:1606-2094(+)